MANEIRVKTVNGPGLWADVGKRTHDLLYKHFLGEQKLSIATTTSSGLTFTSSGIKKGEVFEGDVTTKFKRGSVTLDVKVDTKSSIYVKGVLENCMPGSKAIFESHLPDQKRGKLELQHVNEHAGITGAIGLTPNPVLDGSSVFGTKEVAFGGNFSFDTATNEFTKANVGIGLNKPDFSASIILADKGDMIKASYSHLVNPFQRTNIAAEMSYSISKKENTYTIGGSVGLDPLTTLKARINNHAKIGAVIQHEWRPKSLITLSGEVDAQNLDRSAKLGLALAIKP